MPPKRILIVDDSLEIGRVLRAMLETLDAALAVRLVPSAEEALLDLSSHPVDLLVSDVCLPGRLSGIDLVQRVCGHHPPLANRVLIITGWSESGLEAQAMQAGAHAFMHKPLNMGEFLEKATDLMEIPLPVASEPSEPPRRSFHGRRRPAGALAERRLEEQARPGLSTCLSQLRSDLGAQTAAVLNENGRIIAQAGELPERGLPDDWVAGVMGLLSTGLLVGRQWDSQGFLTTVRSDPFDLLLAPVNGYALVLLLPSESGSVRLPLAVESVLECQAELTAVLETNAAPATEADGRRVHGAPVVVQPPAAEAPAPKKPAGESPPAEEDEFEALFARPGAAPKPEEADAFWEAVVDAPAAGPGDPDMITYDQARRLGLAPEDRQQHRSD